MYQASPRFGSVVFNSNKTSASFSQASPCSRIEKTPRPQTRAPRPVGRASPPFRRISSAVRAAEAEEARIEQAAAKKFAASKPIPAHKVASHVAIPPKRGPGRPPKAPVEPVAAVKATPSRRTGTIGLKPIASPAQAGEPSSVKSHTGKRKHSLGSQPYADPKPDTEMPRKRRKSTPGKTVNFVDLVDVEEEDDSDDEVHVITSRIQFPTPASSSKKGKLVAKGKEKGKATSVKPVAEISESGEDTHVITSRVKFDGSETKDTAKGKVVKKTSKAAAAGMAVKKRAEAKGKGKAKATAIKDVRTTRSGARYTL